MDYLIDTNICIYIIKQQPLQVLERFRAFPVGELGISSISVAELQFGVARSSNSGRNQQALDLVLTTLSVIPFDYAAALFYGQIRHLLEKKGIPIGPFDTLIAAHALQLNRTLVTNNLREFSRVPGLRLENWV
jgi:tRNA(fMet)-specific endonuclease VapC